MDADTDESTVLQEINFIPEESSEQDTSNQLLHSMSKENVEELKRDFKKLKRLNKEFLNSAFSRDSIEGHDISLGSDEGSACKNFGAWMMQEEVRQ